MIQTEVKELEEALEEAIMIAKDKNEPQLLSYTDKINEVNPISFFNKAKDINDRNRFFWTSSTDSFFLVGAGEAFGLQSTSVNRFEGIEMQWKKMLDKSLIFNSFQQPGTGPIALGGFSFDPEKENTELWEKFGGSQFRVPAYLLTVSNGNYYLTINVVVHAEDHAKQLYFELVKNKKSLIKKDKLWPVKSVISKKAEVNPDQWKELVLKAMKEIKKGKADKIVLAREMIVSFEKDVDLSSILHDLIETQTNSYIFAFENSEDCFIGASPEQLVRVEGNQLFSSCLAGTAPRGFTSIEDRTIGEELLTDVKNRQEHKFVVQMIKESVVECCEEVRVPNHPVLYPLKNLQHLYTPVQARLKNNYSIFDIVQRLHPTPALGGFPQDKSLAFIRENEQLDRGWYGAPIGWLDAYQNGEFAVAIRSALIKGREASLFAGCGVVKDSDPEAEYQETNMKFIPMLSVLGG
ncbi:isochorismate synthase [Aquibacillus albus]|uniref:Isochorismate synthase MenF n=1 Tax=Aquibacillus albus TaxID=1168171 RepID=A0ABS2MYG6_9BACI|nr:isochorismate synthase [Aquibacillus albus]MBM7570910.1 menaquinone-specific isochorismate synthase [Aquibacillus albus]